MIPAFFSASWQWGDPCLPCPDKNSSTSVRREPNIGVRRSRTALGDRCIPMPTMFSVPGGTPVGGDCQGISLGWLSGNSFSTERVPLGVRGAERPRLREGPPAGGPKVFFRKTTDSHPSAAAGKKRAGGPQGRSAGAAKPPTPALGRGLPTPARGNIEKNKTLTNRISKKVITVIFLVLDIARY